VQRRGWSGTGRQGLVSASGTGGQQVVRVAAPLRTQVTDLLREAIGTLTYQPGQRLVERDLCERYGVSRTVVREALRHLEAEGLVHIIPNRGPVVTAVSSDSARGLYEAREVLESRAALRCTERATPQQKREIARRLDHVERSYETGTLADALAAKDELYEAICDGAGNAAIAALLRTLQVRAQVLRGFSLQAPGRMDNSLEELKGLVAAIQSGDSALAAEIAATHVRNAAAAAISQLAEFETQEPTTAA
jgi:DNA-binding GntR family transcriptional regulator